MVERGSLLPSVGVYGAKSANILFTKLGLESCRPGVAGGGGRPRRAGVSSFALAPMRM